MLTLPYQINSDKRDEKVEYTQAARQTYENPS